MSQTPKKRGRPSKYTSKEEKDRKNEIKRRAKRQAQAASKEPLPNERFRNYTNNQIPAAQLPSLYQEYLQSSSRPNALANAASCPLFGIDTSERDTLLRPPPNEVISSCRSSILYSREEPFFVNEAPVLNLPSSQVVRDGCDPNHPFQTVDALSRSSEPAESHLQAFNGSEPEDIFIGIDEEDDRGEIPRASTTRSYKSDTTSSVVGDNTAKQAEEHPSESFDSVTGDIIDGRETLSEGGSNRGGQDGNAVEYEVGGDRIESDFELLSGDGLETDSNSDSDSSILLADAEETDAHDGLNDSVESGRSLAKTFLEKTWGRKLCDCRQEENSAPDGEPVLSLKQLVEFWKSLGVPNALSIPSPRSGTGQGRATDIDWCSVLSGGDQRPRLCFEKSQHGAPSITRTWDVDSIISWASCLSINRGLYVTYFPPVSRNLKSSVHVFHQGKPLHLLPHVRLGNGRQSPQFGVYAFFPDISHDLRTTSFLTKEERRLWIDRLLLPAIRRWCPPDVIQHHPRSFDDVESKAYSRRRENCSGKAYHDMDMHHYLPQQYLAAIWSHMGQSTGHPDLTKFRGMFLVLSAKNIKLEVRASTFQECRTNIINHLSEVFDWSKADLSNTWIDIGLEDTATSGSWTFLMKSRCLDHWIDSMRHSDKSPLIASELFNWNLTGQAGSARVETRQTHPLRRGGIAYGQRYNLHKDIFSTAAKDARGLFGEPHLEGMTCPPSLLDAWIVAARRYRNSGLVTSLKSTQQLQRVRKVFQALKFRGDRALTSSLETSFGGREEYRISWALFMDVNPSTAVACGSHRPFWVLPTADVNEFMRWEFNRWLSTVDFVRARGIQRDSDWKDHQRNMIMATILLRSLKMSVNCHHVARRSQMYKDKYKNRAGKWLRGLNFETSMSCHGLAWLPHDLFDWANLHLRDESVESTSFIFNGMQGAFQNWKDVDEANHEYCQARDLERRLSCDESNEHADILNHMRMMVYRHLAIQVIHLLDVNVDTKEFNKTKRTELQQGHHGLSVDVVHSLTGEVPHLTHVRGGKHHLGDTYPQRVQRLFDWGDELPRTCWDHCYYRQLARKFYDSIVSRVSHREAEQWRSTLGALALPYFWIIPNFNKHKLFARASRTVARPSSSRPFCSGVLPLDLYGGCDPFKEVHWLFGGGEYLCGYPDNLLQQESADLQRIDHVAPAPPVFYVVDFGSAIPFTEMPCILEEGFEMCRKLFSRGNRRVLAHYETARECLAQHLGDALCDVLLMIVLTFAYCEVTPALLLGSDQFETGPRKDPRMFAVSLSVRMLWFLYPKHFPWYEDDGMVLPICEMVKKMGRSG